MIRPLFSIGQKILFKHRGEQLIGRIVGTEHVDDQRRGDGWHYFVRIATTDLVDVHESQIDGLIEPQTTTSENKTHSFASAALWQVGSMFNSLAVWMR